MSVSTRISSRRPEAVRHLSISAHNALNHPNYAAPNGDLSGWLWGGAPSTYNREVDLQLRFTF